MPLRFRWVSESGMLAARLLEAQLDPSTCHSQEMGRLQANLMRCDASVAVLSSAISYDGNRPDGSLKTLRLLERAWRDASKLGPLAEQAEKARKCFLAFADPLILSRDSLDQPGRSYLIPRCRLWRLADAGVERSFVLLVDSTAERLGAMWELATLSAILVSDKGEVPLHACGVERNGVAFLFLGRSGAGKSTIAELSRASGGRVVHDDQVTVFQNPETESFWIRGWQGEKEHFAGPVGGFFLLRQAPADSVREVGQRLIAEALFWGAIEATGFCESHAVAKRLFALAAGLARSVRGFELAFRRSPHFWATIEATIGLPESAQDSVAHYLPDSVPGIPSGSD